MPTRAEAAKLAELATIMDEFLRQENTIYDQIQHEDFWRIQQLEQQRDVLVQGTREIRQRLDFFEQQFQLALAIIEEFITFAERRDGGIRLHFEIMHNQTWDTPMIVTEHPDVIDLTDSD